MMPAQVRRVALGYTANRHHPDAILDYTRHLWVALLDRPEVEARLILREQTGEWDTAAGEGSGPLHALLSQTGCGELALQYNPFSYGHWGIAPGLIGELGRARRRGALRRLVLVVHEPFVVMPGLRYTLMGAAQRLQLAALMSRAEFVLATSRAWLPVLQRVRRDARVIVVPVGSNLPDQRRKRAEGRASLGASPGTLVVSTFGLTGPQQVVGHVNLALEAALTDGHDIVVASLGRAPEALSVHHPRLKVVRPSTQDAADLARLLAASDLFLAPYSDGVSSRRTTLMAALQHGLCIVSTTRDHSDPALGEPAMALVPVADPAAFASRARELAADPDARRCYGYAASRLYEQCYAWDKLAGHFVRAISGSQAPATGQRAPRPHRFG